MEKRKKKPNAVIAFARSFTATSESSIDHSTNKGLIQYFIWRMAKVDMSGSGAQLAFFFLLSFFPLLIFLMTLLPYLNLEQAQVFEFLDDVMPPEILTIAQKVLGETLTAQNGGLLSIGVLGTLWSASRGVDALMKSLNRAFDVEGKKGFINRLWALLFTIGFVVVILLTLLLPVFGQKIFNLVTTYIAVDIELSSIWTLLRWLMPPTLIFFLILFIYWIVPNTQPRLKFISVWPGAIFSTAGWLTLTYGFSFYVNNFGNYSATYGSIGGVIILMLWLYFTGMLLIFGGIINAAILKRQQAKANKEEAKEITL